MAPHQADKGAARERIVRNPRTIVSVRLRVVDTLLLQRTDAAFLLPDSRRELAEAHVLVLNCADAPQGEAHRPQRVDEAQHFGRDCRGEGVEQPRLHIVGRRDVTPVLGSGLRRISHRGQRVVDRAVHVVAVADHHAVPREVHHQIDEDHVDPKSEAGESPLVIHLDEVALAGLGAEHALPVDVIARDLADGRLVQLRHRALWQRLWAARRHRPMRSIRRRTLPPRSPM
mmetsp:Transcript_39229/g.101496  ORF Transcript_39229/g.101496 Transcript_39229/m.101496 type:complete len:229 (-) Transcript_39229:16-702(-)